MPTTLKEFETVFPSLVEELSLHAETFDLPENILKWFSEVRTSDLQEHHPLELLIGF